MNLNGLLLAHRNKNYNELRKNVKSLFSLKIMQPQIQIVLGRPHHGDSGSSDHHKFNSDQ